MTIRCVYRHGNDREARGAASAEEREARGAASAEEREARGAASAEEREARGAASAGDCASTSSPTRTPRMATALQHGRAGGLAGDARGRMAEGARIIDVVRLQL